ncbi:MAG TPA: hypothetical protein P5110_07180 [Candidatus Omnitrophota bacterium]|nr:hypothetical protein [Candidatus Omnitrophota bacterium]HRZ15272.1 hypothetical protein [Candidatus Omnitrophota bacterium]
MNIELTSFKDLVEALKGNLTGHSAVITVDGVEDAGQEELAEKLGNLFKCEQMHIGGKPDAAKLKADIAAKRKQTSIIVSGIMLRKIMAAAGIDPDVSVYVIPAPGNSRRGFWEGILSKPLELYLSQLSSDLDKKTVEYHHQFHPIIHADFLVEGEE